MTKYNYFILKDNKYVIRFLKTLLFRRTLMFTSIMFSLFIFMLATKVKCISILTDYHFIIHILRLFVIFLLMFIFMKWFGKIEINMGNSEIRFKGYSFKTKTIPINQIKEIELIKKARGRRKNNYYYAVLNIDDKDRVDLYIESTVEKIRFFASELSQIISKSITDKL
jgi:hypothetical protein